MTIPTTVTLIERHHAHMVILSGKGIAFEVEGSDLYLIQSPLMKKFQTFTKNKKTPNQKREFFVNYIFFE